MDIDLHISEDERNLLRLLVARELVGSRVESHHTDNADYRDTIRARIDQCHALLDKIETALSESMTAQV